MNDLMMKDFADRKALEKIQLARMQETLALVYEKVPFYRQSFDAAGIKPSDLKTLADLTRFPFTLKKDLREHYPFGLVAADKKDIVRIHASSGTTGKPTVVAYTKNDLENWSETVCRGLQMSGLTENDIIQVGYGYGLFTGGLGAHYGVERLGAAVVPASGGATEKQIMLIRDFGVTCVMCTPSFFMHMMEEAERMGIDFRRDTQLRHGIFGAEPWTPEMRKMIEEKSGIQAHDIYGLSEVMGPGVAMDCTVHNGLHIFEDHYYPEIINPETGEVLPEGEEGELVFTNLSKTGQPLVRYRTRDISALHYERCSCGRTIVRMEKVRRRSDDMLIIRGVNVFPSQIESAILAIPGVTPHYQLVISRTGTMDELEIKVEVTPEMLTGVTSQLEKVRLSIRTRVKEMVGVNAKITLVEPGQLPRTSGKQSHVTDLRSL